DTLRLFSVSRLLCACFFSSRRRHTSCYRDWSSDVCSSDLLLRVTPRRGHTPFGTPGRGFNWNQLAGIMERETGFEPATLALARRCSTTELFPPRSQEKRNYTGITREASRRGHDARSTTGQPAGWARLASSHRLAEGRPDSGELRTRQRGCARRRRT